MKTRSAPHRLHLAAAFLRRWPRVNRGTLRADLLPGLIGAIIVLPQGVAFATLAGLPPEYGLYAAMVPAVIAAFFGSSWHLVSGQTNAISLALFATLSHLSEPGSARQVTLVLTLTLMVGTLPPLSMPEFSLETEKRLLGIALAVTALGLTEAVSIARSIAVKSGQRIDGNQEFIGQGLSNIVGSFFSAYASSGSFNRSGVNYEAGARTPLAAAFAAGFLVLILLAVAPLAAFLPNAAMAAILFLVAWGLFDFHHIGSIIRASRSEAAVLGVTFTATLVMHLEMAVLAGVMLSLLLYLNRTSKPTLRSLVPDAADPQRKLIERRAGAPECPQLNILCIEGSLYFGAVSHVGEYLHHLAERKPGQKHLLLLGRSMNFVDVAGAELLAQQAHLRGMRDSGKSQSR